MKQKNCWLLWLILYFVCLIAGFIPNPPAFGQVLLFILSVAFFIPGGCLVYYANKQKDRKALLRLRIISLSSLILTVVFFLVNLLSVFSHDTVGTVLHIFLGIVSVPMYATPFWLVSLFLWSCLFISTFLHSTDSRV